MGGTVLKHFCLSIAGFALAACQTAPGPAVKAAGPIERVVLAPISVKAISVELSGAEKARPEWEQADTQRLHDALVTALQGNGTKTAIGTPTDFAKAVILAEVVLPEATAANRLPTANGSGHWTLGPLPHAGDSTLFVVHQTARTTAGHQLAEIGLGLAFANPLLPDRGKTVTYFALVEGGTGVLKWADRIERGDARTEPGAQALAEQILAAIGGQQTP